jgi:mannosyltransferase
MNRLPTARWASLAAMLILLLAFGLRLNRLEFHSLWSDEGISLNRSARPLDELLNTMPVEQLPGYFVLLHGWLALAGHTDFVLRFFSVWASVLAVAVIYRLGADLASTLDSAQWGRRAATVAALLLAVNPLQLWYAQEARTYSWLMASALLSTWSFWRLLSDVRPAHRAFPLRRVDWLVYVISTTLTVYLHFYGFLVPIAHAFFFAVWFALRRDWRALRWWVSAGLTILALFLPWAPRTFDIFRFEGWREPIDPWTIPWRFLLAYTSGEAAADSWRNGLTWLYLALALLGLAGWWRQRQSAALFLLSQTLIPWAAVFGLALRQPDTHERYALFIAGPLLLLVAGGLVWPLASVHRWPLFWQRNLALAPGVILIVLLATSLVAIDRQYNEAAFQKPDFRTTAFAIQDWEQPGDLILVDGPDPQLVFLHYYRGQLPVHDLRFLTNADFDTIEKTLTQRTAGALRAWEVLYFHEPGPVQFWLARHGWSTPPTEYNGIRVTLYGLPQPGEPFAWQRVDLAFGPALTLTRAAVMPAIAQPGDLVRVSSEWRVNASPPESKFSLRLSTAAGAPIQFQDYVPQNWFAPTSTWPVGGTVTDQRAFLLARDLPSGRYRITLRLYDPANGAAVETAAGQDVVLGEFDIP